MQNQLPQVLPEFRALKALMSIRTEPTDDSSKIRERDFMSLIALWAAKLIPLRISAYYPPTPSNRGDKPSQEWVWAIRRPTDPREPDLLVPHIPDIELITVGKMRATDDTPQQRTQNINYALKYMTRNAISLGVPQREHLGDQWPRWW